MFGSSILDVAIGAIFVFLLLSLCASSINEIGLSFMNLRGRYLLRGLKTLLDDPTADGLVSKIYNHGQIFGLFEGGYDPKKPRNLPSYIPAQSFALAFIDVIAASEQGARASTDSAEVSKSLRAAAEKLAMNKDTSKVGRPLLSVLNVAGDDLAKVQRGIEDWYNSAMDRVSGRYKYRTQWVLFYIGVVLAVALNADTIRIVRQLSQDTALRDSIVAAAGSAKAPDVKTGNDIEQQIDHARDAVQKVQDLGIPLGWARGERPRSRMEWIWALLGWLLTAVAVSLGAPFWFDVLNKFMVVRSTVKPHEKSQEEASKDRAPPVASPPAAAGGS